MGVGGPSPDSLDGSSFLVKRSLLCGWGPHRFRGRCKSETNARGKGGRLCFPEGPERRSTGRIENRGCLRCPILYEQNCFSTNSSQRAIECLATAAPQAAGCAR